MPSDTSSVAGNLINDIAEATENNLWIAHNNGISFYNRSSNTFRNYPINTTNPEIRSLSVVNGAVWACGWDGLFYLDRETDTFLPYLLSQPSTKLSISISKIFVSANGKGYWIATTNNGLCYLDIASGKFSKVFDEKHQDTRVEDIVFHPNGKMYVATYGSGLFECDAQGNILKKWSEDNINEDFRIKNIRSLVMDRSGTIWIGGLQGIATLDPSNNRLQHHRPFYSMSEVKDISVRSLFVDRNGSIWIGSYHDGILLHDDYFSRFRTLALKSTIGTPVNGIVSAFAVSSTGKIYVATENAYLFEYSSINTSPKVTAMALPSKTQSFVVKSLYYDENNAQLWIGTLRDGLFLKKENDLRKTPITSHTSHPENADFDLGVVNSIIPENEQYAWLLTDKQGGIHLTDLKNKKTVHFPALDSLIPLIGKGAGKHLVKVDNDQYLLATKGAGLIYFENKPHGKVTKILSKINDINHVIIRNQNIYVSTHGHGLYLLDRSYAVKKNYTSDGGIKNNIILSSFPDDRGNIWVYTSNGINLIREDGEILNYDTKNGLQLSEINAWHHANVRGREPLFFAGGKDAWVKFSPDELTSNKYVPKVYLTSITLDNKTITDLSYLNKDPEARNQIELKADESLLSIEFSGTNYLLPENNRFRYMMEGYDNKWVYTDHQGSATYNKLPTGSYTFKVQASNNDGIWSENIAEIAIRKLPPWWWSWKAFVLYAILLSAIFWYLRKTEIRKIRLQQEIQFKEAERRRIAEVHAMKIKHFNDISHEIRTPLTLILYPIEELMESETLSAKDKRSIQSMQYHGKNLLLLVNQLLEINRIELKKETLSLSPTYMGEMISVIYSSFQRVAQDSGIDWEFDISEMTDKPLMIDRLQMEKVLLNLLSNAFKFTPKDGSVKLVIATSPENNDHVNLNIKVIDTGIGIAPKDLPHIFERLYKGKQQNNIHGSGIGLALVKAIVRRLMKGDIKVESTVNKGTTFRININRIEVVKQKAVERYKNSLLVVDYVDELRDETNIQSDTPEINPIDRKVILIVEDNADLLNILKNDLGIHYQVHSTTSAEEALELLQAADVDLILSDVMLPGMSGKDFCAEVKTNIITSHIPFIMLTAIDEEESKIEGLELGADDYLTKPFVLKELLLRINNILKQRTRWQKHFNDQHTTAKPELRLNRYDEELIKNLNRRLEETLENPNYTVEDLSADVGLSRVHLFRKLKALTSLSPSQYIRNFKLDKARNILEKEQIRVSELAYKVGFQDPNYFLKCFKEKFGKTPSDFAKDLD